MKFLGKKEDSEILAQKLDYKTQSHRPNIRQLLIDEQQGFCAYSERYIKNTDSVDIEHFDGALKPTEEDGYYNWYAVLSWFNSNKPKKLDERFQPILPPNSADLQDRIHYEDGIYVTTNETDEEAQNLIDYLGFNKHELTQDRNKHIARIKNLRQLCGDEALFMETLAEARENLSFSTALEVELNMNLSHLIQPTP